MRYLLFALLVVACGDNAHPTTDLCFVGSTCPDAAVDTAHSDPLPACQDGPPAFPSCTCGVWVCQSADGGLSTVDVCGPRIGCDAG